MPKTLPTTIQISIGKSNTIFIDLSSILKPNMVPETLKKTLQKRAQNIIGKCQFINLSSIKREARLRCISTYADFSPIPEVLLGFLGLPGIPEDSLGFFGFPMIPWDSRGFTRTPEDLLGLAIQGILANP